MARHALGQEEALMPLPERAARLLVELILMKRIALKMKVPSPEKKFFIRQYPFGPHKSPATCSVFRRNEDQIRVLKNNYKYPRSSSIL